MARPLVSDELWEVVQPLLPRHRARPGKRGRPPVDDRACLTGIVFVLQSGLPWEMLPQEMGCGSGMTCWRRLRDWQRRGGWEEVPAAAEAEGAVRGPAVRHAAESTGAQGAEDRRPLGATADAAWQRLGEDPLGRRTLPGVGRERPPTEDPV